MPPAHVSVSSINGAKDHGVSDAAPVITLSVGDYDAVLFDLDGVLTKTASVHAVAWKKLFDEFLKQRSAATGKPFVPFDIEADYRALRRRKAAPRRRRGVSRITRDRTAAWRPGRSSDTRKPCTRSAAARMNIFCNNSEAHGVEVYPASIALVRRLRRAGHQDSGRLLQQ